MGRLHVELVHPEIHWNTGNAGRTCLAVDAEMHLVQPLGFSLDDKHVRRAGLDYWPRVRLRVWPDWPAFAAALPAQGQPFFLAARAARRFTEVTYPDDTVLIFCRESDCLPPEILAAHGESTISIPMADPAHRSMNLSITVDIAAN